MSVVLFSLFFVLLILFFFMGGVPLSIMENQHIFIIGYQYVLWAPHFTGTKDKDGSLFTGEYYPIKKWELAMWKLIFRMLIEYCFCFFENFQCESKYLGCWLYIVGRPPPWVHFPWPWSSSNVKDLVHYSGGEKLIAQLKLFAFGFLFVNRQIQKGTLQVGSVNIIDGFPRVDI